MHLLVEKKCETLKQSLVDLGARVEQALEKSLDALRRQDRDLARETIAEDPPINRERRILEQEALLTLAAYQPAGSDLRTLSSSLEMVAEMERIADYAANVARVLLHDPQRRFPEALVEQIAAIGDLALGMFRDAMTAYEADQGDAAAAMAVGARDDEVDALERGAVAAIVDLVRSNPQEAEAGIALSRIAHQYERVADRATNIAERVVYIATGQTPDLD